jgi:hypothetical protein
MACRQSRDGEVDDLVDELNEIAGGRLRPERPGFAAVIQLTQPGCGGDGGQARREGVGFDMEIVGDGGGEDAFRGCVGRPRHSAEPVVFVDQPGAQRPGVPVVAGVVGSA